MRKQQSSLEDHAMYKSTGNAQGHRHPEVSEGEHLLQTTPNVMDFMATATKIVAHLTSSPKRKYKGMLL